MGVRHRPTIPATWEAESRELQISHYARQLNRSPSQKKEKKKVKDAA